MEVFIGIDPSLNCSGISILKYFNNEKLSENFYCIKPNKLTKTELKEIENNINLDYILYNKNDLSIYKNMNFEYEYYKTQNIINIGKSIYNLIFENCDIYNDNIYIVMEGVSYGSAVKTSSINDLAGLNYIIRFMLQDKGNINLIISTPKQIKKFATGNGNANKDEIIFLFKNLFNINIKKIDDIADSYFMARYAINIYNKDNNENIQ